MTQMMREDALALAERNRPKIADACALIRALVMFIDALRIREIEMDREPGCAECWTGDASMTPDRPAAPVTDAYVIAMRNAFAEVCADAKAELPDCNREVIDKIADTLDLIPAERGAGLHRSRRNHKRRSLGADPGRYPFGRRCAHSGTARLDLRQG